MVCDIALVKEQWFRVVGTYDESTMRGYRNGVEVCSKVAPGLLQPANADLAVGMMSTSGSYLKGSVDEVAIYETALPAARVKAHYDAMLGPECSAGRSITMLWGQDDPVLAGSWGTAFPPLSLRLPLIHRV